MASDHQVALTRSRGMPTQSSHISKAARQVVPAFLQKLYEMVNDPNNAELIRWSDAGDSFFVLDHERFAHEVLGRWFKHRNFSSFVRQLNMYGFHKIPHLQQGVLKSDTDTEFWNFAHANFRRGQPDLLCLIQRKKQMAATGDEGIIDALLPGPSGASGSNAAGAAAPVLSNGQILDINSIVNGIAVIKRHQTTISAELNELKRSNQLLWQDALAARAKHQKQQDTINRIVKFLAGVFGNNATASSPVSPSSPVTPGGQHGKDDIQSSVAPMAKRKMRLMIEDAKRDGPRKSMIEELTDMPMEIDSSLFEPSNYPTVETPKSVASPAPSDSISVAESSSTYFGHVPHSSTESASDSRMSSAASTSTSTTTATEPPFLPQHINSQRTTQQDSGKQISRAVTPTHPPHQSSPPQFDFDTKFSGILNQLTPAQMQSLLASFASQSVYENLGDNGSPLTVNPTATTKSASGLLTPYHQPTSFDFSINPASQSALNPPSFSMPTAPEGLLSFDNYMPGSATNNNSASLLTAPVASTSALPAQQRLERQWQAAEDIDKDVNAINSSINSLVQAFGLDPALLAEAGQQAQPSGAEGSLPAQNIVGPDPNDYAFFEELFNNMSTNSAGPSNIAGDAAAGVDYSGMPSASFMDDDTTAAAANTSTSSTTNPVADAAASPTVQPLRHVSPGLGYSDDDDNGIDALLSTGLNLENRKKRKSDVMSLAEGELPTGGGGVAAAPLAADPQKLAAASAAAANPNSKAKRRKEK